MRLNNKGYLFIFGLVFFALYGGVLSTGFSGDDYFHFRVAQTKGGLKEFVELWGFHPFSQRGIAFYRPVFRESLYNLFLGWFGLNALPFRWLQFGLHGVNVLMVYALGKKLLEEKRAALFATLFFGIGAANVGILYYLAGGVQALGATTFGLLALSAWVRYLSGSRRVDYGASLAFFIASLASHEIGASVLIVMVGWIWCTERKFTLRNYLKLWPFVLLTAVYVYLNVCIIGFSEGEEQYRMVFSLPKLVNTIGWYGAWSLGLPEMTVDYVKAGLRIDPRLMAMWGRYYLVIWPTFAVSVAFGLWTGLRNCKKICTRKAMFLGLWFVAGILPVAFLPIHKKTYYLALALPGFWMGMGFLTKRMGKVMFTVFCVLLLILNAVSIKLAEKTYWAINRAKMAERLLSLIAAEYPALPKGATLYIKNDSSYKIFSEEWGGTSKQAYFTLNGCDALRLYYNDPELTVLYEDVEGRPDTTDGVIFEIVAKSE